VDLRIVHPVPLAVDDVVAQFHVLDALGHQQSDGSDCPSGLALAAEDRQTGNNFEAALAPYDALDVCTILGTQ
jgi:hypothetical protein